MGFYIPRYAELPQPEAGVDGPNSSLQTREGFTSTGEGAVRGVLHGVRQPEKGVDETNSGSGIRREG